VKGNVGRGKDMRLRVAPSFFSVHVDVVHSIDGEFAIRVDGHQKQAGVGLYSMGGSVSTSGERE
jgi:hypothetical protein